MRRKIAKRKRRYILSKGAEIVSEEEVDGGIIVKVDYLGWHIIAPDRDALSAYHGVIACFPMCEENPIVKGEYNWL